MIRDQKELPANVQKKIPALIERIAAEKEVLALYAFGSLAAGRLRPLSDLDFAVLLSESLKRGTRFETSIRLLGIFNETLNTDEVDLVILNDDPLRFAFHILQTGKLLFCRDQKKLADFIDKTTKQYLDFKPVRDRFDRVFLQGIGYHG
jgi:predicted nucleotidyltransferase